MSDRIQLGSAGLWPVCHRIMSLPAPICYFNEYSRLGCKHRITAGVLTPIVLRFLILLSVFFFCLLSKPFPIGDRVTFSGKDCVCQQCSHTLVKSNEPIKIHGPSRKSSAHPALSVLFRATRRYGALKLMRHVHEAYFAHLANRVSVKSAEWPAALICQLRIMQHKQTHNPPANFQHTGFSGFVHCMLTVVY